MRQYRIYVEPADTDDEHAYLDTVQADTIINALDLVAQRNEIPQHDLVAVPLSEDQEPMLHRCPYCQQWHESQLI
jgi:hypothetical protein